MPALDLHGAVGQGELADQPQSLDLHGAQHLPEAFVVGPGRHGAVDGVEVE